MRSMLRAFVRAPHILACSLALLASCGVALNQKSGSADTSLESWQAFRDSFIEDTLAARPAFAVTAGRHDFDGRLPDWSAPGIQKEVARLRNAREVANAFSRETLGDEAAFERDYLVQRIESDIFWLDTAADPFLNPAFYIEQLDPAVYVTREYAPLDQRMRAYINYANAIPAATANIAANLRMPMASTLLERGISAFKGYANFFRDDVPQAFASIADPELQKQFVEANARAEKAMRELALWLEANRAQALDTYALGPQKFAQMLLQTERVTTPVAQLEAAGRAELARNQKELREACASVAPGRSPKECIDKVASLKSPSGPLEATRTQLAGLRAFIEEQQLVSIPSSAPVEVREAPPYNRSTSSYIDIPGPYEKQRGAISYIAPPDPAWTEAEKRAYILGDTDLLFIGIHQVWPGHFLQAQHAAHARSPVARLFVSYGFAEGWAHYGEQMIWDSGYSGGDPVKHVGQISNALLRNVRFLSVIGLHTGGMTVAESERLFREEGYCDARTARQQAARATYEPASVAMTLGKLAILKLREEWIQQRGGKATWRDFHDSFLSFGGPPIPMVRKRMLGESASVSELL